MTGIWFYDEQLGFISIGNEKSQDSKVYITKNGGKSFEAVHLPMDEYSNDVDEIEKYDYAYIPFGDEQEFIINVFEDSSCTSKYLMFCSEDRGESWMYVGMSDE